MTMNFKEGMRRLGLLLGVCGGILGGCLACSGAKATWDNLTAYRKFESLMASPTMQKVAKAARDYQKEAWAKYRETPAAQPAASPRDPWEEAAKQNKAGQTRQAKIASKLGAISVEKAPEKRDQFGGILVEGRREATTQATGAPIDYAALAKQAGAIGTSSMSGLQSTPVDYAALAKQSTGGPRFVPPPLASEEPGGFLVSVNLDGIKEAAVDKAGLFWSIQLSTGESVLRVDPPALRAYIIPLLYPILGFLLPWGGIRVVTWVGSGFLEPRR